MGENKKENYIYVFDNCVLFEISVLSYLLNYGNNVNIVSKDGQCVNTIEGIMIKPHMSLNEVDVEKVDSFIFTGGEPKNLKLSEEQEILLNKIVKTVYEKGNLVAGICGGVQILKSFSCFEKSENILNLEKELVVNKNVIVADGNKYIDFAIEVGKFLDIFEDEDDLNETIDYFKYFKK